MINHYSKLDFYGMFFKLKYFLPFIAKEFLPRIEFGVIGDGVVAAAKVAARGEEFVLSESAVDIDVVEVVPPFVIPAAVAVDVLRFHEIACLSLTLTTHTTLPVPILTRTLKIN